MRVSSVSYELMEGSQASIRNDSSFTAESGLGGVALRTSTKRGSLMFMETSPETNPLVETGFANGDRRLSISRFWKIARLSLNQIIPVVFAVFINLFDACTFGTVFFPACMRNTSSLAIELFLLSTVVAQLVLLAMSSFDCGLGTSMAENIPFIHTIALGIISSFESKGISSSDERVLATVLVAVSVSTVLNGTLFFIVGHLKLGNLLHFFPRHVILGMTAGFGVFLLLTAVEISTGIVMSPFSFTAMVSVLSWSR